MLRAPGFDVDREGENIKKIAFTANSMLKMQGMVLMGPIVGQAIKAYASGASDVAKQLLEFTKALELANHGTTTQTLKTYKQHMSRVLRKSADDIEKGMADLGL